MLLKSNPTIHSPLSPQRRGDPTPPGTPTPHANEVYLHTFEPAQFFAYNAHGDDVLSAGYFNWMATMITPGAGILVWNDLNDVTYVYCTSNNGAAVTVNMGSDLNSASEPAPVEREYTPTPGRDTAIETRYYEIISSADAGFTVGFYNGYGLDHWITNIDDDPINQYLNFISSPSVGDWCFVTGDAGGVTVADGTHRWLFVKWADYWDHFALEYPYEDRT